MYFFHAQKKKNDDPQARRKKPTIPHDNAMSGSTYGSMVKYNAIKIMRATIIFINENI
jgi:hypothetical protein